MEWSKSTISKSELEKKQREYIEAAMKMAKKAGKSPVTVSEPITEEIAEEINDFSIEAEETKDFSEKEEIFSEENLAEETAEEEQAETGDNFGVFSAEELVTAIENGEVSGEGLKQATEILEEMTRKTETMRKLVEEQENEEEDIFDSGEDYGLNGFINRHNSNCRRCGNESDGNYTP